MRTRDTIKQGHEKAVADQLLNALQIRASCATPGDPNKREPDVMYKWDRETLGIEIATAYYTDGDAEQEWTAVAHERPLPAQGFEMREEGVIGNPDQTICERIQKEIDGKCGKIYAGADELWLCIEQQAALSDAESVERCIDTLKIPPGHQFTRIYVSYLAPVHEGSKYSARKIFPPD